MRKKQEERKNRILRILKRERKVSVSFLSKELDVSPMTVRRDLRDLEEKGLLVKTYGGAIDAITAGLGVLFSERAKRQPEEKERIGKFAATLIVENEVVYLDTSTTTIEIAKALRNRRNLTVVTNSLPITYELALAKDIEIILLCGKLRRSGMDLCGPLTEKILSDLYIDKAFIGADGISIQRGLSTGDIEMAKIDGLIIEASREVIVVADHTKIGRISFKSYTSLDKIDKFITSTGIQETDKIAFEDAGIELFVV